MASGSGQTKRRKPAEGDSPDKYEQLLRKSTEVCGHCNKRCTAKGEAVQCDLCYSWVHASCEGIKKDNYRLLSQITTNIEGVVYYCKLHQCALRFKQFQSEWVNQTTLSESLKAVVKECTVSSQSHLLSELGSLSKSVSELSTKINDFISQEAGLRNHITDTAKALNSISHSAQVPDKVPKNAVGAVEEFSERERRKCNVIVFNLKESTTADADKDSFIELCRTGLKLEVMVTKFFRLGKAAPDKIRPLLITTATVDSKLSILKSAYQLRSIDQYNNVYISPDRSRQERESFRKLRAELKQRKDGGEPNLIIRNGKIVAKHTVPQPSNQAP